MQFKVSLGGLFLFLALGLYGAAQAAELSLHDAKQQGLIGEQYNGYLGVVATAQSEGVRMLVNNVNGKRRAEYARIAKVNDMALADVEVLAGKKSLQRTASGNFVKPQSGSWLRK
jgi:uncharacterized protein YdbL (DUF1318 family)